MSRKSALWSAAALTLLLALLVGAVVLRPVLGAQAGEDGSGPVEVAPSWDDDGDDEYDDDDEYEDDEHDGEYGDHEDDEHDEDDD